MESKKFLRQDCFLWLSFSERKALKTKFTHFVALLLVCSVVLAHALVFLKMWEHINKTLVLEMAMEMLSFGNRM
jgi:hypothetical protein